jgi:hypothetical protein
VSETGTGQADTFDYPQWNADVAAVLTSTCPKLTVVYHKQLGGDCQAVSVGYNDDRCAVITAEGIAFYPVRADLWAAYEGDENDYVLYDKCPVAPSNVSAMAIAHLLNIAGEPDLNMLNSLQDDEVWTDEQWTAAKHAYPAVYCWHSGTSNKYYIQVLIKNAIADGALCTAIFHDGAKWCGLENITSKFTARNMLNSLYNFVIGV